MKSDKQCREHQGENGHQLDQNVDRGAASVFQGVSHCVAHDGSLVDFGAFLRYHT